MKDEQYIVRNTTIKQPKIDPVTKSDTRTMVEKVGHTISFKDVDGKVIMVPAGRERFVDAITGGMRTMERGGMIAISKPTDGVTTALKAHTAPIVVEEAPVQRKRATAVEMGKDDHGAAKRALESEYDGAKNPDGEPNFRVIAPKKARKRQRN